MNGQDEQFSDFRILKKTHTGILEEDKKRFHRFHELHYIVEGQCSVLIGRRIHRLTAGDIAIIPQHTLHKTDFLSYGVNTKYVISLTKDTAREIDLFLGEELTRACLSAGQVTVPIQRREAVSLLLGRMLYEYENNPPHAHSAAKAYLTQFLVSVLRYRAMQEENDGTADENIERIHEITSYIYEHMNEDLTLTDLSEHFAVSASHLSRTFKRVTGFGIREYLVNLRIQEACELLLSTNASVTEIAEQCGFNSSNYFGDTFRKAVGVSPRDYRKLS